MRKRILLPLAVLGLGIIGAAGMIAARPKVQTRPPEVPKPVVRVIQVHPQDIQLSVRTQGSVAPRTESDLVPEVSGRVVWISPSLAVGGFFEKDDLLLRIDPRDYQVALDSAEAAVTRRKSEVQLTSANLKRSRSLGERGIVSEATLDEAENAARVAQAALLEARSALEKTRIDLERTEIHAPFAGRVRDEQVDVGEFVTKGAPVARVYAVDYAEVRLPIPDDELAFIDLPLEYRGDAESDTGPAVILRAKLTGRQYEWQGQIARTEGEIDPRSRMIHAVAQVENPYGRGQDPDRPPLAVGLFVEGEILGRHVNDVFVLPRTAMRGADRVWVVDDTSRLRFRRVDVLRATRDTVVVRSGIASGDRVCVSPLEAVVDGMHVRVLEEDEPLAGAPPSAAIR